jgi:trehalose-6-phosphatase
MIYQPMLELLTDLRANDFQTFIVSGGDIDFMRAWAEKTYGIPPHQVVGSSLKVKYDSTGIVRLPEF